MYSVGRSRGAGGSGIWKDGQLYTSRNYARWRAGQRPRARGLRAGR